MCIAIVLCSGPEIPDCLDLTEGIHYKQKMNIYCYSFSFKLQVIDKMQYLRAVLPKNIKELHYPILYTVTKTGKRRMWACWLDPDGKPLYYCTDGEVGGKLKTPAKRILAGNTRRSPREQAETWAQRKWIEKLGKSYKPDPGDGAGQKIYAYVISQKEKNGGMNRGVRMWGDTEICVSTTSGTKDLSQRHFPMLAKKYKDFIKLPKRDGGGEVYGLTTPGKKITFPCFVQTKVDGLRSLPRVTGDRVILESRNGNDFVFLDHIREEIKSFLKGNEDLVLDGEFYVHKLYRPDGTEYKTVERFQFLSKACKITRSKPYPEEFKVEFWVFDLWNTTLPFRERWKVIQSLFEGYEGGILKMVPTFEVHKHEEIESYMRDFVGENDGRESYEFEGLMVRQSEALYVSVDSYHCSDLLKYKRFEDEEWEIVGAEECHGNQAGAVKWKLQKEVNGKLRQVTAKQMGSVPESQKIMKAYNSNPKKYLGKWINIRFNDRSADGVPRFPRATVIPEDKF